MQTAMIPPDWLSWPQTQMLAAAFAAKNAPLRFVGGCVRDALLGKPVRDVDAATPLLPEAVMTLLAQAGLRAVPTGLSHGTVTAVIDGKSFEITTLRRDIATNGRHAEVAFTDDWQQDAQRRDFTMNALYLSPAGELFDYTGGAEDARAGLVRFIGDPRQRIAEDYLRILRFFRFYAWYGTGEADAAALSACHALASHMDRLSGERIRQEMLKLLAAPQAAPTLELMRTQEVLPHVLGFAIADCRLFIQLADIERLMAMVIPPHIKLAGFMAGAAADQPACPSLCRRLKLPNAMADDLRFVWAQRHALHAAMPLAEQKRLLRRFGHRRFSWLVVLRWAQEIDIAAPASSYMAMLELARHWQPPPFPINGTDLLTLGIAPGKALGEMLRRLENSWETGDYKASKEQLLNRIDRTGE